MKMISYMMFAVGWLAITAMFCLLVMVAFVKLGFGETVAAGSVIGACILVHAERSRGDADGKEEREEES